MFRNWTRRMAFLAALVSAGAQAEPHLDQGDLGRAEGKTQPYTCKVDGKDPFFLPMGGDDKTVETRQAGDYTVDFVRAGDVVMVEVKKGDEVISGVSTQEGFPIAQKVGGKTFSCNPPKAQLAKACEAGLRMEKEVEGLGGIQLNERLRPGDEVPLLRFDSKRRGATLEQIEVRPLRGSVDDRIRELKEKGGYEDFIKKFEELKTKGTPSGK